MAASTKVENIEVLFHDFLSIGIQLAIFHNLLPSHLGIAMDTPGLQPCLLQLAGTDHPFTDNGGAFSRLLILQLGKIHPGHEH